MEDFLAQYIVESGSSKKVGEILSKNVGVFPKGSMLDAFLVSWKKE